MKSALEKELNSRILEFSLEHYCNYTCLGVKKYRESADYQECQPHDNWTVPVCVLLFIYVFKSGPFFLKPGTLSLVFLY